MQLDHEGDSKSHSTKRRLIDDDYESKSEYTGMNEDLAAKKLKMGALETIRKRKYNAIESKGDEKNGDVDFFGLDDLKDDESKDIEMNDGGFELKDGSDSKASGEIKEKNPLSDELYTVESIDKSYGFSIADTKSQLEQEEVHKITVTESLGRQAVLLQVFGPDDPNFETRLETFTKHEWQTISDKLINSTIQSSCSDLELMRVFRFMYGLFCSKYKDDGGHAIIDRLNTLYPNTSDLKSRFERIITLFGSLHVELDRRDDMLKNPVIGKHLFKMLTQIAFGMKVSYEYMITHKMMASVSDEATLSMLSELHPTLMFAPKEPGKLKKHQQLLLFYWREAFKNKYRIDGTRLYKPRFNKDNKFVYSFEYVCEVDEFVYSCLYPLQQNDYWFDALTAAPGTAKFCIDKLTHVKSEWLPRLVKNPYIHSFNNGLFITSMNQFYYFEQREGKHWVGDLSATNLIATRYHDQEFDEEGMEAEMNAGGGKPYYMKIKMEPIDKILDTQKFNLLERVIILGVIGRMLFPIGVRDSWGIFPYFLGLAGTGKSSLLRLVAALFDPVDVGYFNNILQPQFALDGMADKSVFFALDIDEKFMLDQVTFQSIAVGEEVSVLQKYKKPMTKKWTSHGGFASNKMLKWKDNGGSLARRLLIIEFLEFVANVDTQLFEKCLLMQDRFIKVITSAYEEICRKFKGVAIKKHPDFPKKFLNSEQKALLELDPLSAFMTEFCEIERHSDKKTYITSFKDFGNAWKAFHKKNSTKATQLNYSFCTSSFARYQISIVDPKPGGQDEFGQNNRYILGLKLKEGALADLLDTGSK